VSRRPRHARPSYDAGDVDRSAPPPGAGPQDQPGQPFGQRYPPDNGGFAARERPQGQAGRICGIVATALLALGLVVLVLIAVAVALSS
jgi:hypothetical protein